MLEILNFDFLRSGDSLQTGTVVARIADEAAIIEEASFKGPGINLDGSGRIAFDGICDLNFDPTTFKLLDSIPLVDWLVKFGTGFIVDSIDVTGPIAKPVELGLSEEEILKDHLA